jgi:hypothetical protein
MSSVFKYSDLRSLINDFDFRTLKAEEALIVKRKKYE